jgi:hypothetical protein
VFIRVVSSQPGSVKRGSSGALGGVADRADIWAGAPPPGIGRSDHHENGGSRCAVHSAAWHDALHDHRAALDHDAEQGRPLRRGGGAVLPGVGTVREPGSGRAGGERGRRADGRRACGSGWTGRRGAGPSRRWGRERGRTTRQCGGTWSSASPARGFWRRWRKSLAWSRAGCCWGRGRGGKSRVGIADWGCGTAAIRVRDAVRCGPGRAAALGALVPPDRTAADGDVLPADEDERG